MSLQDDNSNHNINCSSIIIVVSVRRYLKSCWQSLYQSSDLRSSDRDNFNFIINSNQDTFVDTKSTIHLLLPPCVCILHLIQADKDERSQNDEITGLS